MHLAERMNGKTNSFLKKGNRSQSSLRLANHEPLAQKANRFIFSAESRGLKENLLKPKILLYSHDTYGLGNIRRTLLLAENFQKQYPESSILIITGSPVIHAFRVPKGIDYIKLPSLDRVDAEKYKPLFLSGCSSEINNTRAAIIEKITLGFNPDLFIVDKRAAGINGELITALRKLRKANSRVKIILGIRDILDAPEKTSRVLRENGSFDVMDRFYDEVWIYGLKEIFDTAKEYEFPQTIVQKTVYCGYLKRPVVSRIQSNGMFKVLVTTGGGGDGSRMIETYLEGLAATPGKFPIFSRIIFGPQMPDEIRASLISRFGRLSNTNFSDFEPDLTSRYAEADLVLSMAGYNTVCELLSHRKRAILVPRSEPVREQLIRAELLQKFGIFDMINPTELTAKRLMRKVVGALESKKAKFPFFDLDGLPRINTRIKKHLVAE